MKVTQEKLPASQVGLDIEIPSEMSKQAYERVLKQLATTANIPGFRKGKVPRHVLLQRFGTTRLKAATLEDLIQEAIPKAIEQESIKVLGNIQLRSSFEELLTNFTPGEPLTFSASVDVPPEVHLGEYTGLEIKAEEVKHDPQKVDQFLEERRKEQATLIPVEGRPAQLEDVAIIDYKGQFVKSEGEEPQDVPGGQAEAFQIELAEGKFVEGFVSGIVGMNVGETKEVPVQFPEEYPSEDLAGKAAVFSITLQDLKAKELPELDDDFAKAVSEFETLAEFRESLESKFREQAEEKTKGNKQQVLLAALTKVVEVDLPESMIDQETELLLRQTAMELSRYGLDVKQLYTKDNLPQLKERSRPDAIERLKQTLGLKEVAQRESLQVSADEINTRVKELEEQLSSPQLDLERLREYVEEEQIKEKALNWLEEHAKIELVPEGSLAQSAAENEAAASEIAPETATQTAPTPDVESTDGETTTDE